jgi:hypothetical protein
LDADPLAAEMNKGRYRHEIPLDLHAALPECAKTKPVEAKPVKRVPYDSLFLKRKYDRNYFTE